jgi:DNA-binding response OmpR family regulator
LVLLDVRLPQIDGITVLERLRSAEATKDLPVIVLTADEEGTEQGFEAGATDYMTKPFSPSNLRARVRSWLQRVAYDSIDSAPPH